MEKDIATLERASSLFQTDELGIHLSGNFLELSSNLWMNGESFPPNIIESHKYFKHISQDMWNISTIIDRLEWSRKESETNEELKERWNFYTAIDIEHVHIELRSIMDYVAEIIRHFSKAKGSMPSSFSKLKNGIAKYKEYINPKVATLIDDAKWFEEFKFVRDSIIHSGGNTLVFSGPKEGILFQTYQPEYNKIINKPFLKYSENVINFDKYFALYFSHAVSFIEILSSILIKNLDGKANNYSTKSYSSGFFIIKEWIECLITELEKPKG